MRLPFILVERCPPLHAKFAVTFPAIIDTILVRSLAKEPDDRYADGAEMADALRSAMVALEGAPTQIMLREEMNILERVWLNHRRGMNSSLTRRDIHPALCRLPKRSSPWVAMRIMRLCCLQRAFRAIIRGCKRRHWVGNWLI